MSNTTISDIAKLAGVGKSTVSRVINGTGYVSQETQKKVEAVIRKCAYKPSAVAQNLSKSVSNTIGVIIPEADNSFFAEILAGISNVVDENDLTLMFCNTDNQAQKDIKALNVMCQQRLRGLIFTPAIDYKDNAVSKEIKYLLDEIGAPIVLVDRPIDGISCDGVYFDNFKGAYIGTETLIKAGHIRIGIIAGDLDLYIGRERLAGYKKAMADYDYPVFEKDIVHGEFNTGIAYRLTKQILESKDLPTAFFVCNNLSSKGFLKAVFERGWNIPKDIAYLGFDKVDGLDIFGLKYSYVDRDVVSMGVSAMKLLLQRIENPGKSVEKLILPPYLKLNGSEVLVK